MISPKKFAYQPYIKNVLIHLPNYKFQHHTIEDYNDELMVGRSQAKSHLLSLLENEGDTGAYLITGYRGMGKTSLVSSVVKKYVNKKNKDSRKVYVKISFGQKDITETDILKQILVAVKDKLEEDRFYRIISFLKNGYFFAILFIISLCVNLKYLHINELSIEWKNIISWNGIAFFGPAIFYISIIKIIEACSYKIYFINKINNIYEGAVSIVSKESAKSIDGSEGLLKLFGKVSKTYTILSPKEIATEIINIFDNDKFIKWIKFIFIFDELDKIESTPSGKIFYYETMDTFSAKDSRLSNVYEHWDRKYKVLNILSSLKYLITECKAKFIFIAGSEMFDAAMADISDRQSALSSIFNQIINVNSFLKGESGKVESGQGVTNLVEEYIEKLVIPNAIKTIYLAKSDSKSPFLKKLYNCLIENKYDLSYCLNKQDAYKVIYTLQHFIVYVTYRSNGSPKKMIRIIEENIVKTNLEDFFIEGYNSNIYKKAKYDTDKNIFVFFKGAVPHVKNKDNDFFILKINYKTQYRIGLLNYIFRPIIISNSRILKNYSDSLLVAIPYLMDHLIKFHSFAFSLEHLELMPEVLSSNRSPELRIFLEDMVGWIKQNLIRDTSNGFFEYKFLHKISKEINYASKTSDQDSAAFNFTYDENYSIKLLLRVKIKELRSIYKDFGGGQPGNPILSIAFLNILLADTFFYDEEYNDAISTYLDALQAVRYNIKSSEDLPINYMGIYTNPSDMAYMPEESFYVISIKCLLKIGLTYEKMKSYDFALSYYFDVLNSINKIFNKNNSDYVKYKNYINNTVFSILFVLEKKHRPDKHYFQTLIDLLKKLNKDNWIANDPSFLMNLCKLSFYKGVSKDTLAGQFFVDLLNPDTLHHYVHNDPYAYFIIKSITVRLKEEGAPTGDILETLDKDKDFDLYISIGKVIKITYNELIFEKKGVEYKSALYSDIGKYFSVFGDIIFSYYVFPFEDSNTNAERSILKIFDYIPSDELVNDKYSKSNLIEKWMDQINEVMDNIVSGQINYETEGIDWLDLVIYDFLISALLLHRSGDHYMAGVQYNKIMEIIRYMASKIDIDKNIEDMRKVIFFIEKSILRRMLEISSWNSGSSDRTQVYKLKQYFGIDTIFHPKGLSKYNYMNISNSSDFKDALVNYAAIRAIVMYRESENILSIQDAYNIKEQALVTPYTGIFTQFSRVNELDLQCVINKTIFYCVFHKEKILDGVHMIQNWNNDIYKLSKKFKIDIYYLFHIDDLECEKYIVKNYGQSSLNNFYTIKNYFNAVEKKLENEGFKKKMNEFPYLIANWIFCMHNIINTLKVLGVSFFYSNSIFADCHRRYAEILKMYELCRWLNKINIIDDENNIDSIIEGLIGVRPIGNIDSTSQYQMAGRFYYKVNRAHSSGAEYKSLITNLYFLEDDFDDMHYMFSIAFERRRLRAGEIKKRINEIRSEVVGSQLFNYDYYANNEEI